MTNDELTKLLGYKPNEVLRRQIIDEVRETGLDVRAVVAKRTLPELAIIGNDGKFDSDYGRITPTEWYEKNPLGRFGRLEQIVRRKHTNT